jgi:hypothetical protein
VSWRVILRPKAEEDLRTAACWYESQRGLLGSQFLDEINRSISALKESPERHAVYYRGFRRMPTRRFHTNFFIGLKATR